MVIIIDICCFCQNPNYMDNEKYKMIGKSVTDLSWLDEINSDNQNILIVVEGLTMYLSEQELHY